MLEGLYEYWVRCAYNHKEDHMDNVWMILENSVKDIKEEIELLQAATKELVKQI